MLNDKWIKIMLQLVVVLVLIGVIWLVCKKLPSKTTTDNVRFSKEYTNVGKYNIYVYASKEEVLKAFEAERAVVFFGFPECSWCQAYVKHLNEIAKEYGVSKILYYNIMKDREENSEFYVKLTNMLEEYLLLDEFGVARIYVPDVYFIKSGKIIGHNNDTSTISDMELEEYYTEENTELLQEKLKDLFVEYSNCDDKKGC